MTESTDKPRLSRLRRREAMLNSIAKLIGCTALVVTVAVVFYVVVIQLDKEGPRIDPAYIAEVAQSADHPRWSGRNPLSPGLPKPSAATADTPRIASLTDSLPGPQTQNSETVGILDIESKRPLIEKVVEEFFTAPTLADKAVHCRDKNRILPAMELYYQSHPLHTAAWQKLGWVLPMNEPGHRLAYAQALFTDGDPVCIILEESEAGNFRVDWESSVRYCELDWSVFLSTRPDQPTLFRVIASKPQPDAETGVSHEEEVLEIKHPAEQGTVYAYFNKTDPQFQSLVEQLRLGNWNNVPLTLRLCYPGPTSNARAVRIAGVEGKGWLILHKTRS